MRPLLPVSLTLLLAACSSAPAYRQPPAEPTLAEPVQDDRGMYLDLIRKMQAQGAYYASLAHIDAFRQRHGDTPELRLLLADAQRETGQREAAAQGYQALLKTPALAAAAWHGLGLIAASGNDLAGAEQALATAATLAPLNATYQGDLGYALLRAGRLEAARTPLAKAAELEPGSVRAVSNLALWALVAGQTTQAEQMILRAGLPLSTRQEIYRLAQSLRAPQASAATPAAAGAEATAAVTRPAVPYQRPQPPGSMLDRFGQPSTVAEQESLP